MTNAVYVGSPGFPGKVTVVTGTVHTESRQVKPLPLRLDLANHSPTGFAWGYGGSGPAQLALAILADTVSDELALKWHQHFKMRFLSTLDGDQPFQLPRSMVVEFVLAMEEKEKKVGE